MTTSPDSFSTQDIVAYALGESDAARAAQLETAAQSDARLAGRITQVTLMLQTLRQGVMQDAPASLRRAAMDLWKPTKTVSVADWLGGLTQSALELVFDSRNTPMLAGFRGGSEGRHVTFADGELEVDVVIDETGETRTLRGQVTGAQAVEAAVLCGAGRTEVAARADVDADGMFVLSIGTGACDLAIKTDRGAYRLSDVL